VAADGRRRWSSAAGAAGGAGGGSPAAVAERARALGLPVEQPARVRAPEFLAQFGAYAPISPSWSLSARSSRAAARAAAARLHQRPCSGAAALAGAAPIAVAIAAGDAEIGVTIQQMAEELTAGRCGWRATAIGAEENAGELGVRLADSAPFCCSKSSRRSRRRGEGDGAGRIA
jgi:methionyl-tRNA formyltransferase